MRSLGFVRVLTTALALFLAGCGDERDGPGAIDQARLLAAASEPQNWLTASGGFDEQRYSTLKQINTQTVGQLGLAWSFEFDTNRGQEATPVVVDGVIYTSTAWSKVYAIDARTGKQLWQYDPKVSGEDGFKACCDVVNRGVAVWKGRVYVGAIDGRLIALDAQTGKPVWSVLTVDKSKPYTITGAPRVFDDKVIIGNGGAEFGVRGYVTAYDTDTGKQRWRFYTVPGDPAKGPDHAASDPIMRQAVKTWAGKWYDMGGGGTAWDSIVYDPEFDQVYIGVGNGSPWDRKIRSDGKGDNLFLSSIVALDAKTGRYKWHYQTSPGDSWDYTATQPMMLAELPIGGKSRKVLMQAPKNGFFYILDRQTGKLLSAKSYVKQTWVDHIDMATGRPVMSANAYYDDGLKIIEPATIGGHNWQPMSFSPQTGLVYIPTVNWSLSFEHDPGYKFIRGAEPNIYSKVGLDPMQPNGTGALIAWDPVGQREVWRVKQPEMVNGGTLATAGALVFSGDGHGEFSAFDARSGQRVWSFKQQSSIMAAPATYELDGVQYVAVLVGKGGGGVGMPELNRPRFTPQFGRLLVFKLGGKATLPAPNLAMQPANPPGDVFPTGAVARGEKLYSDKCSRCHEGWSVPDLRRSAALNDVAMWKSIVLEGVLAPNGMVSFSKMLTPQESEDVRAYVGSLARDLAREERKGPKQGATRDELSRVKPQ
ncbi:PQQ-dependent dehydrogenase, methanol/ethanol family [Tsuneonella rigui]|uniref:PQQ-dependent dehydrogenase, methanol/ethanol family n=1 Tax=Tsuneonella rigui TaxID=1708790 RepID=UPI000F7F8958|nr:PQQ-dependent dehydrogenase, methanol/ethanol family [Tsuneonella rigui]